jgi:NAD(P)-dependent dehydrogenase (short-subunit alcohol dehydrogenase family)
MRFAQHVVWITGAGSGIGRALALEFARQGADLALSGRRRDKLAEVGDEIRALGRRALEVPLDVAEDGACEAAVATILAELGQLDVAIANAGFSVNGAFERLSLADWRRQFDINVIGAVATAQAALPALRARQGRLVFIASVMGLMTLPGQTAYSASKFALRAIGLGLAQELHGTGVSCSTLHPGFVESEIAQVNNRGELNPDRPDKRPQKLMWPADKAARVMVDAVHARAREYTFTGHGRAAGFIGRHMPGLVHFLATRGPVKVRSMVNDKTT